LFKIAAEAFCVVEPKQKIKKIKAIVEKLLNYTKNTLLTKKALWSL